MLTINLVDKTSEAYQALEKKLAARKKSAEWRKANPERFREAVRRAQRKHGRWYYVYRHYGLTEAQYDHLLVLQGCRCAGCGKKSEGKPLFIDHDHSTGKVRGLLCGKCNSVLGLADDKVETLQKLSQYLQAPPADQAEWVRDG